MLNRVPNKKRICVVIAAASIAGLLVQKAKKEAKQTSYKVKVDISTIPKRNTGFYEKNVKRIFDVICAGSALLCFGWLYIVIAILVKVKLGSPILFTQDRPGIIDVNGRETVFKMYKFRTMTNECDENGELLPDEMRLTKFGAWLRTTSLDELPEVFNILNGTMSVVGPRPLLVRDMVFMTNYQRIRHTAKPGLTGLAQINGRNAILWEEKLAWDQEYIKRICLMEDIRIVLKTIETAFIKQEGITEDGMATAEDLGDYLLRIGSISKEEYDRKQNVAKDILGNR